MTKPKLKPCPFCGTHRYRIVQWPETNLIWGAEVRCECGGRGPQGYSPSHIPMACDLWNRRQTPQKSGAPQKCRQVHSTESATHQQT